MDTASSCWRRAELQDVPTISPITWSLPQSLFALSVLLVQAAIQASLQSFRSCARMGTVRHSTPDAPAKDVPRQ